jgi:hypothetical protein
MKQLPQMFCVFVFGLCSLTATGEMTLQPRSEECHRIELFPRQHWSPMWPEEELRKGITQSMRSNWGRLIGEIGWIDSDPGTRKEIRERTIVLWGAGTAGELSVSWGGRPPWQKKVKNRTAGQVARMLGRTFPEARVLQVDSDQYAYVEFPSEESLDFDATGVHGLSVYRRDRLNPPEDRTFALLDCALGARPYAERAQGGIDLVFVDRLAEGYGGYRGLKTKTRSSFMNVVCLSALNDWSVAHESGHPLLNGGKKQVHRERGTVMCIPTNGLVCSGIDDDQVKDAVKESGPGRTPRLLLPCGERTQDVGQGEAITATSPSLGQSVTPPPPPPPPPPSPPPATPSPLPPPRQ